MLWKLLLDFVIVVAGFSAIIGAFFLGIGLLFRVVEMFFVGTVYFVLHAFEHLVQLVDYGLRFAKKQRTSAMNHIHNSSLLQRKREQVKKKLELMKMARKVVSEQIPLESDSTVENSEAPSSAELAPIPDEEIPYQGDTTPIQKESADKKVVSLSDYKKSAQIESPQEESDVILQIPEPTTWDDNVFEQMAEHYRDAPVEQPSYTPRKATLGFQDQQILQMLMEEELPSLHNE